MKWSEAIALANVSPDDADNVAFTAPAKRRTGRPTGRHDPTLDWKAAELFFIEGVDVPPEKEGEIGSIRWPTMVEVAKRLGCSKQLVCRYAQTHNWADRKGIFKDKIQRGITIARADSRLRLLRSPLEIVEDYLGAFDAAVQGNKLRTDAMVDFDKAVRLRAFLLEQNEQAKGASGDLSLEQLQARHREVRDAELTAALNDDAAGVTYHGADASTDGEGDAPDLLDTLSDTVAGSPESPPHAGGKPVAKPRKGKG